MEPMPPVLPDLTLLRLIGGGSYGDVWLARTLTGVYRAVKIVNRARFPDDRPFLRELDGITRFQQSVGDQPRQLALMHVGRLEPEGILYYVMELADDADAGTSIDPASYTPLTLKELHRRRKSLPAAECVRLGVELCRSLGGMHRAGLIHRDVKPSNIIFVAGVPKLADIGLVSSSDHTLTSLGTPGYSPPEGAGTVVADIYSLGRILYELASGRDTRDFPRLPPDVGQREDVGQLFELNDVIMRACMPNPLDRYATAQDMLDDLLLLQAGKSVKALHAARERVRQLMRLGVAAAIIALGVITILGVKNYFAAQQLAAQESAARLRAEADERFARYTADLHLAQLALTQQDLGIARSSLRRQIPEPGATDLRGPEWYALWNDAAGNPAEVFGEPGGPPVREMELSPDGNLLVAQEGGIPRNTVVWDLGAGTKRPLVPETLGLGGFLGDGSQVIVSLPDRTLHRVELATGALLPAQSFQGRITRPVGDGRNVIVRDEIAAGFPYRIWDTLEQREVAQYSPVPGGSARVPQVVVASPDGQWLASSHFWSEGTANQREIVLWDLAGQRVLWIANDPNGVQAMDFSPDKRWLAVAGEQAPVRIYDTNSGQIALQLSGHVRNVPAAAFSPDGQRLATGGSDQTIRIWSVPEGEQLDVLRGHEATINRLEWIAGGSGLISAASDGTIRRWQFPSAIERNVVAGLWAQTLGDFLFSPDGSQIAVTDASGTVVLMDARTLDESHRLSGAFQPLAWIGDDSLIALSADRELVRCDPAQGIVTRTSLRLEGTARPAGISSTNDGRRVVIANGDRNVFFWDTSNETSVQASEVHPGPIWESAISDDASVAATSDGFGNLFLWNVADGRLIRQVKFNGGISGLVFAPGSLQVIVGLANGSIAVVETATGAVGRQLRGHSSGVLSLTRSPDGSRIVSAGNDGFLIFWRWPDLRVVVSQPLTSATARIEDKGTFKVRFSSDGTALGAFTEDGHLRIWRTR